MYKILSVLLLVLFATASQGFADKHKSNKNKHPSTRSSTGSLTNHTRSEYSDWSAWGRCVDCLQRRIKTCISETCEGSRVFEERPCHKKRCKRKMRQKDGFHVVRLNENSNLLTKQAPYEVWSRWSSWSDCSSNCRTERFKRCRKPGRCNKKILTQEAFCYREGSTCELYVIRLMQSHKYYDARRYQYNNNQSDAAVRQPRKKVDIKNRRCGLPYQKSRMLKIIGGRESQKNKWPWHVAILNQQREVICGGTLIASRWILTANHCIRKYLQVKINAHNLTANDGSDMTMKVHKIFPHPQFDYKTVDNDIALLMLPRSVRSPVACLPTKRPKPKQLCYVMGWGKTDPINPFGINILHEAKLPIVTTGTCRKSNRQLYISDNMLCAGWASGKSDTCAGDSGGGLMCPTRRNNRKSRYTVQGITSFGDGCGMKNKYGIYTTVYNYINWINYVISTHDFLLH